MARGDINVTVVGNLTADPELQYTNNGTPVANFRVASTSRVYKDGQWVNGDEVFLSCSLWREAAENMVESLSKGMRVIVTGRLKQRSYETREGEKRTVLEVEVDDVGPSLMFARAQVAKTVATKPKGDGWLSQQQNQAPASDPWNSSQPQLPDTEQPPF